MTLGTEDLATELGMDPSPLWLTGYCQQIVLAARAAGILPLGYADAVAGYADLGRFRRTIRRARALGFCGSSCIHPMQVPILNEGFTPPASDVAEALEIVETAQTLGGQGVFTHRGRMIDAPILARAERVLALSRRVAQVSD